jgi:hypothetical protein
MTNEPVCREYYYYLYSSDILSPTTSHLVRKQTFIYQMCPCFFFFEVPNMSMFCYPFGFKQRIEASFFLPKLVSTVLPSSLTLMPMLTYSNMFVYQRPQLLIRYIFLLYQVLVTYNTSILDAKEMSTYFPLLSSFSFYQGVLKNESILIKKVKC